MTPCHLTRLPIKSRKSITPVEERHYLWADRIRNVVSNVYHSYRGWRRSSWAKSLAKLEVSHGDAPRVERVLSWWESHPHKLKVQSATGFSRHFLWLEDMANKDPYVKVSEQSLRICESLTPLRWPGRTADLLPVRVQQSIDFFSDFFRRLDKIRLRRKAEEVGLMMATGQVSSGSDLDRAAGLARHLSAGIRTLDSHVLHWWIDKHTRVTHVKTYNGDLSNLVPSPTNKYFNDWGLNEAAKYGGRHGWSLLLRECHYES
jgi:hypothetical protein